MTERKTPSAQFTVEADYRPDIRAMKAFSHPLRMAIYQSLNDRGEATSTMLAEYLGESTGQTSYHLRQLEKHGFVEEVTDRGTARERWWKSLGFRMDASSELKEDAADPAVSAVLRQHLDHRAETLLDWNRRALDDAEEWKEASSNNSITVPMTVEQVRGLSAAVLELVEEHITAANRQNEETEPEGAADSTDEQRRIRIHFDIFPLPHE